MSYNDEYTWEIAINNYHTGFGDFVVGVMDATHERQQKGKRDAKYSDSNPAWVVNLAKGLIASNSSSRSFGFQFKGQPYCPVTHTGVIGVRLNNKEKTLSFTINGQDYGVAFNGVQGRLYPTLTFFGEAASGTLLKVVQYSSNSFILYFVMTRISKTIGKSHVGRSSTKVEAFSPHINLIFFPKKLVVRRLPKSLKQTPHSVLSCKAICRLVWALYCRYVKFYVNPPKTKTEGVLFIRVE